MTRGQVLAHVPRQPLRRRSSGCCLPSHNGHRNLLQPSQIPNRLVMLRGGRKGEWLEILHRQMDRGCSDRHPGCGLSVADTQNRFSGCISIRDHGLGLGWFDGRARALTSSAPLSWRSHPRWFRWRNVFCDMTTQARRRQLAAICFVWSLRVRLACLVGAGALDSDQHLPDGAPLKPSRGRGRMSRSGRWWL